MEITTQYHICNDVAFVKIIYQGDPNLEVVIAKKKRKKFTYSSTFP